MHAFLLRTLTPLLVAIPYATVSQAQLGGVANSGMEQGSGSVSSESDVRLSLETGRGATSEQLAAAGGALSDQIAGVRECYRKACERDPSLVGKLRFRITLGRTGAPRAEIIEGTVSDAPFRTCVTRALRSAALSDVPRPAEIHGSFEFHNTRAAGIAQLERDREAQAAAIPVQETPDGFRTSGRTIDGAVEYAVTGATEALARAVHDDVRASVAGLLDCRRKASRRDRNPAGTTVLNLRIGANGRGRAREDTSTVEDRGAPRCLSKVIRGTRFGPEARGSSRLTVTFSATRNDATP